VEFDRLPEGEDEDRTGEADLDLALLSLFRDLRCFFSLRISSRQKRR
jgi:hypothetical protein